MEIKAKIHVEKVSMLASDSLENRDTSGSASKKETLDSAPLTMDIMTALKLIKGELPTGPTNAQTHIHDKTSSSPQLVSRYDSFLLQLIPSYF